MEEWKSQEDGLWITWLQTKQLLKKRGKSKHFFARETHLMNKQMQYAKKQHQQQLGEQSGNALTYYPLKHTKWYSWIHLFRANRRNLYAWLVIFIFGISHDGPTWKEMLSFDVFTYQPSSSSRHPLSFGVCYTYRPRPYPQSHFLCQLHPITIQDVFQTYSALVLDLSICNLWAFHAQPLTGLVSEKLPEIAKW